MNESGRSVAPALRFYKLPPERLVVVHDELDLELGDVRAKQGGGLAGHNGLRSLADVDWARRTSCACGSASAGRSGATAGRWPTGCCSRSRPAPTSTALVRDGADCALAVLRDGRGRGDARRGTGARRRSAGWSQSPTRRCGRAQPRRRSRPAPRPRPARGLSSRCSNAGADPRRACAGRWRSSSRPAWPPGGAPSPAARTAGCAPGTSLMPREVIRIARKRNPLRRTASTPYPRSRSAPCQSRRKISRARCERPLQVPQPHPLVG